MPSPDSLLTLSLYLLQTIVAYWYGDFLCVQPCNTDSITSMYKVKLLQLMSTDKTASEPQELKQSNCAITLSAIINLSQ